MTARATKPPKPYTTFPLFAHAKGYWAKSVCGRHVTFGKWAWPDGDEYASSWKAALDAFKAWEERRARGLETAGRPERLTLAELSDLYLHHQLGRQKRDEITARMFCDAREVVTSARNALGRDLAAGDLAASPAAIDRYRDKLAERLGWHAFNRNMAILSCWFRWCAATLPGFPIGADAVRRLFPKQSAKALRRSKRRREEKDGKPIFHPDELKALLDHANPVLRTMILLGYFGAYGNSDIAQLPATALQFDPPGLPAGWALATFPRPKTDIEREAALPPIVVTAIRQVMALGRPAKPASNARLIFRTQTGRPYVSEVLTDDAVGILKRADPVDSIGVLLKRLRARLGRCEEHGWQRRRSGDERDLCECGRRLKPFRALGFYSLRRTAITAAVGAADPDVLHRWRGHVLAGMSRHYVQAIDPKHLQAIAEQLAAKAGLGID